MTARTLTDDDLQALADRVADRLLERSIPAVAYADTATIARMLAVSEDWVRDHAAELHAVRLGADNGPLRFRVDRVLDAIEARRVAATTAPAPPRRPGPVIGYRNQDLEADLPHPDRAPVAR